RLSPMFSSRNRRNFLKTMAGGAVGLSLSRASFAQRGEVTTTKLADNFMLVSGAGSNVLVLTTPDGLLMVDGGMAEHSAALLKLISGQADGARIQVLFNTHWHLDHTGSNESVAGPGTKIVAHENTKLWMGAEIISMWEKRTYKPRPKEARPNTTFYTT